MTGGRNGKGYGVLATPFRCVAFHDTPLHRTVNIHSWKEIAL